MGPCLIAHLNTTAMSKAQTKSLKPTEHSDMDNDSDVIEDTTCPSAIWTAEERAVLKRSIEGYQNAPKNNKAAFIAQVVVPEIKGKWRGRYSKKNMVKDSVAKAEWARKKKVRLHSETIRQATNCDLQQIFTWFPNHASTARKMRIPGFNCKVTFDSVVLYHKKKEIEELAQSMAGKGGAESHRKWFPFFQTAKKNIKKNLSDEEMEAYLKEVKDWEKDGVPLDVQIA